MLHIVGELVGVGLEQVSVVAEYEKAREALKARSRRGIGRRPVLTTKRLGRYCRRTISRIDNTTANTIPCCTPTANTTTPVSAAMTNSLRRVCQILRRPGTSIRSNPTRKTMAPSTALGMSVSRPLKNSTTTSTIPDMVMLASCVRPFCPSRIWVLVGLPFTTKVPVSPAAMFAPLRPRMCQRSLTRKRSLVQIQYRPRATLPVSHTFAGVWRWGSVDLSDKLCRPIACRRSKSSLMAGPQRVMTGRRSFRYTRPVTLVFPWPITWAISSMLTPELDSKDTKL